MAATLSFRWLEILEKEFDKSFVDLDLLLGEIDPDQCELTFEGRQKMTALSAAFAQLCHKAQTIFQSNAKIEAQLLDMRSGLAQIKASKTMLEGELGDVLLQLHSSQLQRQAEKGVEIDSSVIKKKVEEEMEKRKSKTSNLVILESEMTELRRENDELRQYVLALQGEVYGARLAAKYLDKELAGRIQQIQLLGRDMRGAEHDKLWNQLEAEIHLHRHKTVIRACRGRSTRKKKLPVPAGHDFQSLRKQHGLGDVRKVVLNKGEDDGLGLSITGGKEHGVPILISEIHEGQPAERCESLYVGDAILSVNQIDLRNAKHAEAVQVLSQQQGVIELEVMFVAPDEDSEEENNEYDDENGFRYRIYDEEVLSSGSEVDRREQKMHQTMSASASADGQPMSPSTPKSPMSTNTSPGRPTLESNSPQKSPIHENGQRSPEQLLVGSLQSNNIQGEGSGEAPTFNSDYR
ncbi:Golgi-associated PDZ and coiled-coil motif-containing protein-like [Mizuhopecten yessoensis]|uniref:Golgi-associated PDZ and coiled-coil motif-containing protein n=1 Tax=Mizuhopecten yessoensis TaxID=6573 RepID=A0A210QUR0_MIZYE|nr:Golgi-associated PDZ and coiled-coil motif-containing protein-like [Mizuhopecten yessoensis]OWF52461.1 Golgi-associated PDZ and coiled-coil motif-containing protein [Mizuhopecten yessoensis]